MTREINSFKSMKKIFNFVNNHLLAQQHKKDAVDGK